MSTPIITRCGFRCDLCPAYRENVERDDRREHMSKGFKTFYGVTVSPEELFCDGCLDESPGARRVDSVCKVRPCVIAQGFENCAHCGKKGCAKLKSRLVDLAEVEKKTGGKLSARDYNDCVKPFENKKLLASLAAKYAASPRLLNKEITPTMPRIRSFVGKTIGSSLDKIDRFMIENACGAMIIYDPEGKGWNITYRRKGKNLLSIYPERQGLAVHITLGKHELKTIAALPSSVLGDKVVKAIASAKQTHEGKSFWIHVKTAKDFTVITKFLELKAEAPYRISKARR